MKRPLLLGVLLAGAAAVADEGMWTFNNFPADKVKAKYGFETTKEWLENLRLASVRIAGGCSASVVSADGLVLTNHHCVRECVDALSGAKKDYNKNGFFAKTQKDELRCDTYELNQLSEISDVTDKLTAATKGVKEEDFVKTQRAEIARIEKECQTSDEFRCEVVTLYRGGRYDLYKYRRFQDIRLVFAPEEAIAFFGGDPDNFMFPRYDLDMGMVRIYGKDGKPMKMDHFLPFASEPLKDGDLTFVSGNPGGTSRLLTMAQLADDRDYRMPIALMRMSEYRGMITEYQNRGAEQKRHSNDLLFGIENGLKAYKGRQLALADADFWAKQQAAEDAFQKKINANPEWKKLYGNVWANIAAAVKKAQAVRKEYNALEGRGVMTEYFGIARTLVRAAEELPKPNPDRLREYADARKPQLVQALQSKAPIYDEFEIAKLSYSLVKLREDLGPDHPVVKKIFGTKAPQELAKELIKGTRLRDVKLRMELFEGGKAKVDASKDPMILFVKSYDADARAIRKKYEDEVDGPLKKNGELIAKARFLVYGTSTYPDATFTLRLSYGTVKGYLEDGKEVKPFTTIAGAFDRHTGAEPFALPKSWLDAKAKLNPATQFDVCTTNDIIGGNSGSPMVNKKSELVGLIFDGNIQSLGGDYGFDESVNRAVAVTSDAILEALDKVYGARRIVDELRPAAAAPAKTGQP